MVVTAAAEGDVLSPYTEITLQNKGVPVPPLTGPAEGAFSNEQQLTDPFREPKTEVMVKEAMQSCES